MNALSVSFMDREDLNCVFSVDQCIFSQPNRTPKSQQANKVAVTLSTRHGMTLSYGWCKVVNESFYTS